MPSGAAEYVLTQAKEALRALYGCLPAMWVGDPFKLRRAEVKPLQLLYAHETGLLTPHTLITNNPDHVGALRQELSDAPCAVKPLHVVPRTSPSGRRWSSGNGADGSKPLGW